MEKFEIVVPKDIRFISDWSKLDNGFSLSKYSTSPHILNKVLTGCGFTEYCITCPENVILCSPRRILLENKENQHVGELLYARNNLEKIVNFERDFTKKITSKEITKILNSELRKEDEDKNEEIKKLKRRVWEYYEDCQRNPLEKPRPCKILVTYDSFRHVKEALGSSIENFYIVVDEFQSILVDARFKSTTELEFINYLKGLTKVCYVSATPILDKYLAMLDEFKDLPYFFFNWEKEDPARICRPNLKVKYSPKLNEDVDRIINSYLEGNFQESRIINEKTGKIEVIQSKEAVIFVNSVFSICNIIRRNKLTLDQVNILCAKTEDNESRLRKALNRTKKEGPCIGSIPKRGEPHKMFTFCTRTVYLGADFYSTNARSFVFSDSNLDCMSVDIAMDLEQILGRQRLNENPWKNYAELYYKTAKEYLPKEEFDKWLIEKDRVTRSLLGICEKIDVTEKYDLSRKYKRSAISDNYKHDWVSVNICDGKTLTPVYNNLVRVSEMRNYEIQQIDYKDRFHVFNSLEKYDIIATKDDIEDFLLKFDSFTTFRQKMKFLCELDVEDLKLDRILSSIPMVFKNYFVIFGPEKCKSYSYQKSRLEEEYQKLITTQGIEDILSSKIFDTFKVGESYTKSEIKLSLANIYKSIGSTIAPKATNLKEYFEIKEVTIYSSGKKEHGYKILSVKV